MKMDIDDICNTVKKSNNKVDDQMEFVEKNYNKVFMTMGDKEINCITCRYA